MLTTGLDIFGPDAAESDRNLGSYFLQTSSWRNVTSGRTLVVLGRKGTGKSAIFKMLKEKAPDGGIVAALSPKAFALNVFAKYQEAYPQSPFNLEMAYAAAWRYSLLLEALLEIERTGPNIKLGAAARVHDWIRDHREFDADFVTRTVSFLQRWTLTGVSIGAVGVEINRKGDEERMGVVGSEIDATVRSLELILDRRRLFLAVDNLDEGWSDTKAQRAYLVGLVLAAKEISTIKNLHVVLFLRTEAFRALSSNYQHLDKFRESVESIVWTASSLQNMACRRIRHHSGILDEENTVTWARVFPAVMKNGFPTYKHMVERTMMRPREIIQFCRLAVDTAARFRKQRVDERDMQNAEREYSSWKVEDLSGEYSAYYENVKPFLLAFRRTDARLSRHDLELAAKSGLATSGLTRVADGKAPSVDEAVALLYQMGFIRARQCSRDGRWRYTSSTAEPDLVTETIEDWDIHPAFRSRLVIKSDRGANHPQ